MKIDLEQLLLDKAVKSGKPLKATLELTPVCNFDCEMCYIRHSATQVEAKGGLMNVSFWENVIDQLKDIGVLVVCLIGGEPFLYPQVEEIYRKLTENGFLVNITTNASLLAKGIPEWLRNSPPRYVTVSLYGASDDTYYRVTGHSNGYSMAIKGIENLLEAGINVKLNYLATPGNKHDLEKIVDIKNKYNLPLLATSYSHPVNRKDNGEDQKRLSAMECAEYDMKAHYYSEPEKYSIFCKKIASGENYLDASLHGDHVSCYAGTGMVWIDWQGHALPCSMLSHVRYSLKDMSLKDAWELLKDCTAHIKTCVDCVACEHRKMCRVCAGSMYIETGSTSGRPEYICTSTYEMVKMAQEFISTGKNRWENDK